MTTPSAQRDAPTPPMPTPVDALEPGTVVADRYRIVERIGEGGMGAVYRVEHVHMRKALALKVLRGEMLRSAEAIARFEREAVAAAAIEHPNVVAAKDFGKLADGSFFLILELVNGRDLRSEVRQGPMAPARAIKIVRGVAEAIGAAHEKNIVHRDLKPENIMLVERDGDPDFVKVLDFGIAKLADPEPEPEAEAPPSGQPLTRVGVVMGTPDYMAPEQAFGQPVDARTDLYGLGVIFYELLTGACPFRGQAVNVLRQHVMEPPPELPPEVVAELSPSARDALAKLLAKEPAARFQSARELLAALDPPAEAATAMPLRASMVAESESSPARTRLGERRIMLIGAGALLVAIVLIALGQSQRKTDESRRQGLAASASVAPPAPRAVASEPAAAPAPLAVASVARIEAIADPSADAGVAAESARTADKRPAPASSASPATRSSRGRRTGPGGIYIPPPKDWFK